MTNSNGQASDEELVAAYQRAASRETLDELVRRHLGRVRAVVIPMVLNDAVADDLTQETFLRAIRGLGQFDGRANAKFSTWLYRVALNTTYSYLSRQGRSPVEFRDDLPERLSLAPPPERMLLDGELRQEIERGLAKLTPRLRAAIVLTALQGLEPKEAAEVEGCTTGTMYWRIHEARRQLARHLQSYLSEDGRAE